MSSEVIKNKNILFFDGVCHLCNGYIHFLNFISKSNCIFYSPIQGNTAKLILSNSQIKNLDSLYFFKNNTLFEKSDAVIESLAEARSIFNIIKIFYLIPRFFRNIIYDLVAKNRYRLFGKSDICRIPTSSEQEFLLD